MKPKPIVFLLALSTLFFAMLLPPEAYPAGKMAVILGATFVFLIALFEKRIPRTFVNAGAWIFGLLLLHTLVIATDLYRALDTMTLLWAYYCLIGFFMYSSAGYENQVALSVVGLSLIVSGYGLYQYFWGFDEIKHFIMYSGSDAVVTAPAMERVATRRVFSTLALPGTLWGFLVCALPFHAMLWKRHRLLNPVLVASALMLLTACFLTRSFGFLAGLFVLVVTGLWLKNRRLMWTRVAPAFVILALAGGIFYSARRGVIENADPVGLRFKNWVSAWNVFESNPLGTGLNSFGIVYSQYMQPNANETQYVHNTALQLLSELGYPLILALVVIAIVKAGRGSAGRALQGPYTFWLLLALAVWVAHNMIDIDVYFGSVGVLGAVIIGMLFTRPLQTFPALSKPVMGLVSLFSFGIIVFSATAFLSSELQHRAQIEYENKKLQVAAETLASAQRISPINSSLYHDSGDILLELYQIKRVPQYLTDSVASFRKEISLSPRKSGAYVGYALCLSTVNKVPEALEQIHLAKQRYPSSAYIQAVAQLMQRRIE